MVSGGRDRGFFAVVETISCIVCKELFDAVADEKPEDLELGWRREEKPLLGIRCPNSEKHEFTYWKSPWPCPVCDEPVIADGGCINWD